MHHKSEIFGILQGGNHKPLVSHHKGIRYLIIATNHESRRQHALRKMGE